MSKTYTADQVRQRLADLPRLRLANLPTPLDDLERLSAHLGPRLLIKREDLTGLAFGGNKIREFEYQIAQAVEQDYDVLLHAAAAQSNQSRQTSAVGAKIGLRTVIVGRADAHAQTQGNLLLTRLFGAEVHLPPPAEQAQTVAAKMEELRLQGHKPFNTSSECAIYRSIAYVDGFLELWGQLQERGIHPDAIYLCSGAHTHVGLVVGARALGLDLRVVGISPSPRDDAATAENLAAIAHKNAGVLGLELEFTTADFESYAAFAGPEYGVVTDGSRQAIQLFARQEGIVLDPSYTGKTVDGLLTHIRQGWWNQDHTIVFLHTGGTPALFAYNEELGLDS